jgi:hypothetical protein
MGATSKALKRDMSPGGTKPQKGHISDSRRKSPIWMLSNMKNHSNIRISYGRITEALCLRTQCDGYSKI